MMTWLKQLFSSNEERSSQMGDDLAIKAAKRTQEMAQEDHEEAMELIKLLEVENKLNNYATLVESALRGRTKAEQ